MSTVTISLKVLTTLEILLCILALIAIIALGAEVFAD